MGKINTRVHHKDQGLEDHAHKLPNGKYTGGMLLKPNSNQSFPHTHLYQKEGKTLETNQAPVGGDHTHITELGITSGPTEVGKDE